MTTEEDARALENPDNWDFDKAEIQPGRKAARVVVSVALPRGTFEQVSKAAETLNQRISEFIREAALERVLRQAEGVALASVSGPFVGALILNGKPLSGPPGVTRVPGSGSFSCKPVQRGVTDEWAGETTTS